MNIAIFSFVGVIVGALLQYLFTRHLENHRHLREIKTKLYTDYMLTISENANSKQRDSSLKVRMADAKSRVCLYASPEVIDAFAKFDSLGSSLKSKEQRTAFIDIVRLMRIDSGIKGSIKTSSIQRVLLGNEENK